MRASKDWARRSGGMWEALERRDFCVEMLLEMWKETFGFEISPLELRLIWFVAAKDGLLYSWEGGPSYNMTSLLHLLWCKLYYNHFTDKIIHFMYKIAKAVITRFHELGGLNNRIHSLTILEARNLSSRCWQCWFLLRPLSLTYKWLFSPLSLFFFLFAILMACGISVPQPGIEPGPWQWKPRGPWQWKPGVLTIRQPENASSLSSHGPPHLCVCVLVSSYKDTNHIGLGSILMNSLNLQDLFKDPISKYIHILRC